MAEWTECTVIELKTGFYSSACLQGGSKAVHPNGVTSSQISPVPNSHPNPPWLLAADGSFNNHPTAQRQLLPTASLITCATQNNASIMQPTSNKLYALCSIQKCLTFSEITLISRKWNCNTTELSDSVEVMLKLSIKSHHAACSHRWTLRIYTLVCCLPFFKQKLKKKKNAVSCCFVCPSWHSKLKGTQWLTSSAVHNH